MACLSELRGLGAVHASLQRRGGTLAAVSVDPPETNARVVSEQQLSFPILSDSSLTLANTLGILHDGGAPGGGPTLVPAHVLVTTDGRIAWRYVSALIQDRPDPENVFSAVEAALGRL